MWPFVISARPLECWCGMLGVGLVGVGSVGREGHASPGRLGAKDGGCGCDILFSTGELTWE